MNNKIKYITAYNYEKQKGKIEICSHCDLYKSIYVLKTSIYRESGMVGIEYWCENCYKEVHDENK